MAKVEAVTAFKLHDARPSIIAAIYVPTFLNISLDSFAAPCDSYLKYKSE